MPELKLEDHDGTAINLKSYRGKILLLNFWMVHSAANAENDAEMSAISLIQDKFSEEDRLGILGVTMSTGTFHDELGAKYLKEKGITFKQVLIKPDQNFYRIFGRMGWPNNVLIDTNGKMIGTGLKGQELEDAVAAALAKLRPMPVSVK